MDALPEIPIIDSVRALKRPYRVWLTDIWGVMHDGISAFPGAVEATNSFRREGGVVILISNAPRPADSVATQIAGFDVPASCYDAIISSGDLTRELLTRQPGVAIYHLGPSRDVPVFEGLDIEMTTAEAAKLMVCTGLFDDDTETPDDYKAPLSVMAARGLPMICANPDIKVERGDKLVWCAGALAQLYEQLGGQVIYAGKPHAPVYELALERASSIAGTLIRRQDVLAIGDGPDTDIKGAIENGFDAVYVASGLHAGQGDKIDQDHISRIFRTRPRPIAAMDALRW